MFYVAAALSLWDKQHYLLLSRLFPLLLFTSGEDVDVTFIILANKNTCYYYSYYSINGCNNDCDDYDNKYYFFSLHKSLSCLLTSEDDTWDEWCGEHCVNSFYVLTQKVLLCLRCASEAVEDFIMLLLLLVLTSILHRAKFSRIVRLL